MFSGSILTIHFSRFHRGMTRPFFTRDRVNDFDIYDRNFEKSVEQANARLAEGYSIDFQVCNWPTSYSAGSYTEILLQGLGWSVHTWFSYRISTRSQRWLPFSRDPLSALRVTQESEILLWSPIEQIFRRLHRSSDWHGGPYHLRDWMAIPRVLAGQSHPFQEDYWWFFRTIDREGLEWKGAGQ